MKVLKPTFIYIFIFIILTQWCNLFWQSFNINEPTSIDFSNWDIHTMMFLQDENLQDGLPYINRFSIYGPYAKYVIGPLFTAENSHYWPRWIIVALYAGVLCFYLKACLTPWKWFVIFIFACLFNFPSIFNSIFILWIWALGTPDRIKSKLIHLALGSTLIAFFLLFKPALGIISLLFMGLSTLLIPNFGKNFRIRMSLTFTLFGFIALTFFLGYGFLISYSPQVILNYLSHASQDASSYSETMMLPLTRNWPFIKYYPIFLFIAWLSITFISTKTHNWKWGLIATPILFIDFKHAFTRSDYSNIQCIFWIFPLLCFFWLIRFPHRKNIYILFPLIFISFIFDTIGLSPQNVPWRHPRNWWIPTPNQFNSSFLKSKESGSQEFTEYLKFFKPMINENKPLISFPGQIYLNQLSSKPLTLPSLQNYFGTPDQLKIQNDNNFFSNPFSPNILWQADMLDNRIIANARPHFYLQLFENYKAINHKEDYFLLEKREHKLYHSVKPIFEGPIKKLSFKFKIHKNALLLLQTDHLKNTSYAIKKMLYKGDRLIFNIKSKECDIQKVIAYSMLDHGAIIIFKPLDAWSNSFESQELQIDYLGSQLANSVHDFGKWLYDSPQEVHITLSEIMFHNE